MKKVLALNYALSLLALLAACQPSAVNKTENDAGQTDTSNFSDASIADHHIQVDGATNADASTNDLYRDAGSAPSDAGASSDSTSLTDRSTLPDHAVLPDSTTLLDTATFQDSAIFVDATTHQDRATTPDSSSAQDSSSTPDSTQTDAGPAPFAPFTARVSTQTINPAYGFTAQSRLVETADRMAAAGFDSIKIRIDQVTGPSGYCLPALNPAVTSSTDLISRDPSYLHVFNLDFSTYILWLNDESQSWRDGFSDAEKAVSYTQNYDVTCHLLKTYVGTNKTFLIGHWEGDWLLKHQAGPACDQGPEPTAAAIQGMIDWLNTRAQAVADARANCTIGEGVQVRSYAEVNCVLAAIQGLDRMTNRVLPHINVDAISYSAYDVQGGSLDDMRQNIQDALNFIKQNAVGAAKNEIFVGEYGFPYNASGWDDPSRADRAKAFIQAAASWGAKHVLWWQLYDNECTRNDAACGCNEFPDNCQGFWLFDTSNHSSTLYDTLRDYNSRAHVFKDLYRLWLDRNPDESAINSFSQDYLNLDPSTLLNNLLRSSEYHSRVDDNVYATLLASSLLFRQPSNAEVASWSGHDRADLLDTIMNSAEAQNAVSDDRFVDHLYQDMLGRPASSAEHSAILPEIASQGRAAIWRIFLSSQEFRLQELDLRTHNQRGDPVIRAKFWFAY